tara:strand:- start:46 stop:330 length:285 start_codon:yes stop_codon:yes gene_type:complete
MDLNKSLRAAIDTGNVQLGTNQVSKTVESGNAKLVIIASNCPDDSLVNLKQEKIAVHHFKGNNSVLGAACGKPFPVSALAIIDEGKSDVLSIKN